MEPLIIEVALNGGTPKSRKATVPISAEEIAADILACGEAGATVFHSHVETMNVTGDEAAARYLDAYAPVLRARPETILWPTVASGRDTETRFGHLRTLAAAGIRMAVFDPGSVNLATEGPDGLPDKSFVYRNSHREIAELVAILEESKLGPAIAIYEPGWLRTTLAWERAGRLPAGAFVKLYFNGRYNIIDGRPGHMAFGLPPTRTALDAYLEIMDGSSLPWAVAAIGDCVLETGLAQLAIERGGHVRVGLEDFGGERTPSNRQLVEEVTSLARKLGRPIATTADTARILKLPR